MAHHTVKSSYAQLVDRLNRFPQGAPPSELLYKILEMLFSEREAELVSKLPIRTFTAEKASHAWKLDIADTQKTLDELLFLARTETIIIHSADGQEYVLEEVNEFTKEVAELGRSESFMAFLRERSLETEDMPLTDLMDDPPADQ